VSTSPGRGAGKKKFPPPSFWHHDQTELPAVVILREKLSRGISISFLRSETFGRPAKPNRNVSRCRSANCASSRRDT